MAKQTWVAEYGEMSGYDCMSDAYVVKDQHATVAVLDLSDYGQESCTPPTADVLARAEANARLIAAAPDMLAALLRVRDASMRRGSELHAAIEAAIAKATKE
jgi:hypothetical protein